MAACTTARALILLATMAVAVSRAAAATPSIEAEGANLRLTADDVIVSSSKDTSLADVFAKVDACAGQKDLIDAATDSIAANELEITDVNSGLTKVARDLAASEDAVETVQTTTDAHKARIVALESENKQLKEMLGSLTKRLDDVEKSTGNVPATCDYLKDPSDGKVTMLGDHGDTVPVSVTVHFECDAGYFLRTSDTASTCRIDSGDAKWSVGAHPGCASCSKGCAQCESASTCTKCSGALGLVNGACKEQTGLSQVAAADSCAHILKFNPQFKTRGEGYWIKIPGTPGAARRMWCMMPDVDKVNGGGWTLVGRGVGGNPGCWGQGGAQDCNANGMMNIRSSFMYKDTIVNGIPTLSSARKIRFSGFGTVKAEWYFKANSDQCQYAHKAAAADECNCVHKQIDFTDTCPEGNVKGGDAHMGIGSWLENGLDNVGCLHSSTVDPSNWFMRSGDKCGGKSGTGTAWCSGNMIGCSVALYVR